MVRQSTRVLLLTREPAIRNLVEQVCLIEGHATVTATTVEEAHTRIAQSGRDAFALGVIDTAVLGPCDQHQPHRAHQLWQDWGATYPGLPLVFLGMVSPNDTRLAGRGHTSEFLSKPLRPGVLAAMIRRFFQDGGSSDDEGAHA